nr:BLUF domain-containing protein [Pararhodobacter zhoushanensis]
MHHIAYVSRSLAPLDALMLDDILDASVRNNERDGITGVLMYHDQLFFQVLEGGRQVVELCYERIKNDLRHSGVSLIWSHVVKARVFAEWAMGYAGPEEIGAYSDDSFHSLADILLGKDTVPASECVALSLARLMYKDFKDCG